MLTVRNNLDFTQFEGTTYMKPIFRTLKYFTIMAEQYFLIILGICALYFGFFALGADGNEGIMAQLYVLPYQFILFALIMILVLPISLQVQFCPLILGMNSTRKNLFFGLQWTFFLLAAQMLLVSTVFCIFVKSDVSTGFLGLLPALTGVLLCGLGLGSFLSGISGRFGKTGLWVMLFMCGFVGGISGFVFAALGDEEVLPKLVGLPAATIDYFARVLGIRISINHIVLFVGILVYLLGSGTCYLLNRKTAVRN